jgi:hypothetical protein
VAVIHLGVLQNHSSSSIPPIGLKVQRLWPALRPSSQPPGDDLLAGFMGLAELALSTFQRSPWVTPSFLYALAQIGQAQEAAATGLVADLHVATVGNHYPQYRALYLASLTEMHDRVGAA